MYPPAPPYGAPAAPSQPYYGQPAAPSQPFYGQPGMPSMPLPPQGFGPPSQTLPGTPPAPPPAPKKSRRKLWITLASVAVLLVLLGGGTAFALVQYFAPASAAGAFCGDLQARNYTAAYGMFTKNLKSQFTQDQFTQGAQTLDTIEGNVTSCGTASGSAYNFSFGSSTASVTAAIKRVTAGSMQGLVHLKNEDGGWKVDGLDASLLGINLNALLAASAFCTALQTQDYATAYGVLGSSQTDQVTQQVFAQQAQLHDQIDGKVTACALTSIAAGADDTKASLGVSITRAKLGIRQGTVNFDVENSAWKIGIFDQSLLGSDLGPLTVGTQFCTDLKQGNYTAAYGLFAADFQASVSLANFKSILTPPSPLVWSSCTPDLTTYQASTGTASYVSAFTLENPGSGQTASINFKLEFVNAGTGWELQDLAQP
jgi:hypothetical protein